MIVIGLTGSIGMGKSAVAHMLRHMGIPVHDSDRVVHDVLQPHGKAFAKVSALFPEAVEQDHLNRQIIGDIIFHDTQRRKALEAVIHPLVKRANDGFLAHALTKGHKIAVLDIPLLFEVGAENRVDVTFVVSAPKYIQRRRVLSRPGMTEDKFNAILAIQMPDSEKRRRADAVIPTGYGRWVTKLALKCALRRIKG